MMRSCDFISPFHTSQLFPPLSFQVPLAVACLGLGEICPPAPESPVRRITDAVDPWHYALLMLLWGRCLLCLALAPNLPAPLQGWTFCWMPWLSLPCAVMPGSPAAPGTAWLPWPSKYGWGGRSHRPQSPQLRRGWNFVLVLFLIRNSLIATLYEISCLVFFFLLSQHIFARPGLAHAASPLPTFIT